MICAIPCSYAKIVQSSKKIEIIKKIPSIKIKKTPNIILKSTSTKTIMQSNAPLFQLQTADYIDSKNTWLLSDELTRPLSLVNQKYWELKENTNINTLHHAKIGYFREACVFINKKLVSLSKPINDCEPTAMSTENTVDIQNHSSLRYDWMTGEWIPTFGDQAVNQFEINQKHPLESISFYPTSELILSIETNVAVSDVLFRVNQSRDNLMIFPFNQEATVNGVRYFFRLHQNQQVFLSTQGKVGTFWMKSMIVKTNLPGSKQLTPPQHVSVNQIIGNQAHIQWSVINNYSSNQELHIYDADFLNWGYRLVKIIPIQGKESWIELNNYIGTLGLRLYVSVADLDGNESEKIPASVSSIAAFMDGTDYFHRFHIPYWIDDQFTPNQKTQIHQALTNYEQTQLFSFQEVTRNDQAKIRFETTDLTSDGVKGDASPNRFGVSVIRMNAMLEPSYFLGTVTHEIGHVMGLQHQPNASSNKLIEKQSIMSGNRAFETLQTYDQELLHWRFNDGLNTNKLIITAKKMQSKLLEITIKNMSLSTWLGLYNVFDIRFLQNDQEVLIYTLNYQESGNDIKLYVYVTNDLTSDSIMMQTKLPTEKVNQTIVN